jgi:hypothetical protein
MRQQGERRFTPDPEITAAYQAICRIVEAENLPVDVKEPGVLPAVPETPLQMVAAFPVAYTVELVINPHMVCVARTGRFGISISEFVYVDYPTPPTAEDFQARLAETLVAAIRRELEQAAENQKADLIENGPFADYEAVDAVRQIDD